MSKLVGMLTTGDSFGHQRLTVIFDDGEESMHIQEGSSNQVVVNRLIHLISKIHAKPKESGDGRRDEHF